MKERNEKKAKILYDFLDESKLFKGTVEKKDRSLMNVPFVTGDADLDALFVKEAKEAGFVNLKGHRTVGGMRASIYNAMPIEGVEKLVAFMREFEKKTYKLVNFKIYAIAAAKGRGNPFLSAAAVDFLKQKQPAYGKI